jgi:hypothetical protein
MFCLKFISTNKHISLPSKETLFLKHVVNSTGKHTILINASGCYSSVVYEDGITSLGRKLSQMQISISGMVK